MRRRFVRIACASLALSAAVACATAGSEDAPPESPPDVGEGGILPFDASRPKDAEVEIDASPPVCSTAGWCVTPLPDSDLVLDDIWPREKRAFAIGGATSIGTKVMEWDGATNQWSYIDDNSQNAGRMLVASIWAPSDDEVYYTLTDAEAIFGNGAHGSWVYHGTRPVPPATAWSWTRHRFACDYLDPTPRVWGTSPDDVYVVACRQVHHRSAGAADAGADAGESAWTVEYADDDPANRLELSGIAGTDRNDLWFVGARGTSPGSCLVVVRKTAAGYERVVDGIARPDEACDAKPGLAMVKGAFRDSSHAPAKGRLVGVRYSSTIDNDVVRIAAKGDGSYAIDFASPAATMDVTLGAVWGTSEDDLWLVATRTTVGSAGSVVRGTNLWGDAGVYQYSTLALNGSPNTRSLGQIRGTSNTNLWAVGRERAFHKTTP